MPPDSICAGHLPGRLPVLSDAATLRSLDGILARLPRGYVGRGLDPGCGLGEHRRRDHGRATGRVLRLLLTLPLCGVLAQGCHDGRVETGDAIDAIPGPTRGPARSRQRERAMPSANRSRARRSVAVSVQIACSPSPSRSGNRTGRRSRSWRDITVTRSCGAWANGWPPGSAHRSLARASSRRPSSRRSRSSSCGAIRPCRGRPTAGGEARRSPASPGDRFPSRLVR